MRPMYFRSSAKRATGLMRGIGQQSVAYLPLGFERQRTVASPISERELPTLTGLSA